ncbi:DUF6291 domain-containing protein [Hungatella sp. SB206]|jgi:hypothetical protein|uniref:DUF6291 domain-containing protein n=1 Tax=Hungatella sp. SB206 TaxID=2937758 RepID=UPI003DA8EB82
MKNSFVMYTDYMEQVSMLSREQRGDLFTAIMAYASNTELPNMDGVTMMAFCFIRSQMDRDRSKYQETIEKRREAGKQGGRPKANGSDEKAKKANGFSEKQTEAKKADNDNVNENDNVDVNVNDNEDENEKEKKKGTNVPKENSRFVPPSVENVIEYCRENDYRYVDANHFVDFYISKNWYVGKNKMKDWKAAVRNWQRQESAKHKPYPQSAATEKQEASRGMMYDWAVSKGEDL